MAKRKKMITGSLKAAVGDCPKKVSTLCWILPFAPPATGTYPSPSGMPFNIVIKEDHCQPY